MVFPRQLLASKDLHPKKHMGQNFLVDPSTSEMIVRRAEVRPADVVLEIGPGLGALTVPLARAVRRVHAVEKDRDLISLLAQVLEENQIDNVTLDNRNILDVDLFEIAEKEGSRLLVFGNLPYNISSQVIIRLIESRSIVDRAVFMFQKELARRIVAEPGTGDYSRLTVMVKYCARARRLAAIAAHQFYPRPNVDSEIIEIVFESRPINPATDERLFSKVVKVAFGRRRKTLKNALSDSELGISRDVLARLWNVSGIDPARRAETLSVPEFVVMANSLRALLAE